MSNFSLAMRRIFFVLTSLFLQSADLPAPTTDQKNIRLQLWKFVPLIQYMPVCFHYISAVQSFYPISTD